MAKSSTKHRWQFFRAGGVDQVRLDEGADIFALGELDQKLWVALSCPVKGLEFDQRTLQLLDSEGDGFVHPREVLSMVEWLREVLRQPDSLVSGKDEVDLSTVRDDTPEGKRVLAAARMVLANLGKEGERTIALADTQRIAEVFAKAKHNGDGVVPPSALDDEKARRVAEELLRCLGGEPDRSGQAGFTRAKVEQFFADCAAYDAWMREAVKSKDAILCFGERTAEASAAARAVRHKIDDYFGRCRLAAYDPRAQAALNREETAYLEVAAKDLSIHADEIAHLPLSHIEPDRPLAFDRTLNPAWEGPMERFRELCLPGAKTLDEAEWTKLQQRLAAYDAWAARKAGASVEALGLERVREILSGKTREALLAAVDADLAVAPEVDAIGLVEKLARMNAHLHKLLRNYVNFADFYSRAGAIFQAGTLYLDGRALDLCFQVTDAPKHGALAVMAKTYLAYVDCTRPGAAPMTVACAFTAGDSDNLFVGRNGIFYDRQGRDWNATIQRIVDNPISIGQAFFSPYKKLMRWIEESVAKRAAAAEEGSTAKLQAAATSTGEAAQTGQVKARPKVDIGVVAAIGVAVGGIAAAFSALLNAFFGLGIWMPLGVVALVLAISGPSMLIAWLKLRQRNLGPILDASGWAVNTLTRVNIPLGRSLTQVAQIPPGSARLLTDPYAPKKRIWPRVVLVLLFLAAVLYGLWHLRVAQDRWPEWIPRRAQAAQELPAEAPAEPKAE